MSLRQRVQSFHQRCRQGECHIATGIALYRWTRPVGGQLEQRRRTAQVLAPEPELLLQRLALQPLPLPERVVGILDRQWWQRVRLALAKGLVQGGDFADHHPDRPTVGHDVVLRHQQHVLLRGQAQQLAADQRAGRQIKRALRLPAIGLGHRLRLRGRSQVAQVPVLQREADRVWRELLHRAVLARDEARAQALMPRHYPIQRSLQRHPVQCALQAQRRRHVVRRTRGRIELIQEPQPLLRPRQRQHLRPHGGNQRLQRARRTLLHTGRKGRQRGMTEHLTQRHFPPQQPAHGRDHLGGQQRVSAQCEEVVLPSDTLQPQQLGPDAGHLYFDLRYGRFMTARGHCRRVGGRQRGPVQLAVGGQRPGRQHHERAGQHVLGQLACQCVAQHRRYRLGTVLGNQVGHQPAIACPLLPCHHHCLADARARQQLCLDLPQLDAEAADLDLTVQPTEELECAVRPISRPVAGAIEACVRLHGKGTADVALGGQSGTAEVAGAQAFTADVQIARHPNRARTQPCVQHVVGGILDGATIRYARPRRVCIDHLMIVRPDRGFRGPAQCHHLAFRERPAQCNG
ncbi:hypothetical protein CPBF367_38900 [Xanthomonas arboricola pv. juglandis]|nr:hypothetical protein CPBF367_38900 [Xanthomonas arboricola pv. juglandis]